jgi:hypothetical protein
MRRQEWLAQAAYERLVKQALDTQPAGTTRAQAVLTPSPRVVRSNPTQALMLRTAQAAHDHGISLAAIACWGVIRTRFNSGGRG